VVEIGDRRADASGRPVERRAFAHRVTETEACEKLRLDLMVDL